MIKLVYLGLAAILGTVLGGTVSPASAVVFDFSYTTVTGPSLSGHGEFITGSSSSPYFVTDVTGTAIDGIAGTTITGTSTFASADNLLFFPSQPYTDFFGISFSTVSAGDFNLYFNTIEFNGYGVISRALDPTGKGAGTEVRLEVAATPLPGSLPLFASGLAAMIGLFVWRRRGGSPPRLWRPGRQFGIALGS